MEVSLLSGFFCDATVGTRDAKEKADKDANTADVQYGRSNSKTKLLITLKEFNHRCPVKNKYVRSCPFLKKKIVFPTSQL